MGIEKTAGLNLAEIIAYNGTGRESKDRPFLMFRQETDEILQVSYADFYRKSLQCGHLIQQKKQEQGIGALTRFHVGVFMQNIPEFFYILGGCAFTNSTLVGINNAQVGDKLAFDINNVDMNLLFVDTAIQPGTDGSFLDTVLKAKQKNGFATLDETSIISIQKSRHESISFLDQQLEQHTSGIETFVPTPLNVSGAALVIFTSGTTGAPKGIEISWEKMTHVGIHATGILKYTEKDVGYVCMPVNHSNSLYLNVMPAIMNNARIFLRRKFSVSGFIRDIQDSGATIWNCVGDPVQYLLNHFSQENGKKNYRDLPLRTVISTGTNAVNRAEFTDLFGLDIFTEVYGSTEAGALTAVDETTPACSVGRLLKDVRIVNEKTFQECEDAVLDENGAITNLDRCSGEVVVSQNSLGLSAFTGYYKLPQESLRKLISIKGEMFYRMGDLGAIVEQKGACYLIFLGRTGDWIRYKGENWAPVDGIRMAGKYKGIINMAIIGVPQSTGREDDPMYILEIRNDDPFDVPGFYAYCRENLPHYMLPRFIRIMEKLPMTETLKLKNTLLKKDFYYRDEELDHNSNDRIYEIKNHAAAAFQILQYQQEIAKFVDPVNQDTLKAFTGRSDLFSAKAIQNR
jgi:fatty-acyl-CoA synthase